MDDEKIKNMIRGFAASLPSFEDGRIDFSESQVVPVVTCFVKVKDEILLMKRSKKVKYYPGRWNTVAGHLDRVTTVKEMALEELREEIGLLENDIGEVETAEPYMLKDDAIGKTWLIHLCLIELERKPTITMDWEHTDFVWVKPEELSKYDIVDHLEKSLTKVMRK